MPIKYSLRSLERLNQAHPDLQRVLVRAAEISGTGPFADIDWTVLEVARTLETQKKYVASGASRTMNSRHLPKISRVTSDPKTGKMVPLVSNKAWSHAVDIAPLVDGAVSWAWPLYRKLAPIIKEAARIEKVPIIWGGDWRTFKDGPHFELDRKFYP
jgi:peptidoglycan L-alanyl-D-glutamate endopeptidase CwlK